jgi:hypothetical protein
MFFSVLLVFSGCSKPVATGTSLGKEFTLTIGQSEAISGDNLSIKFIDVISDSRCPTGVTCIWAGEASCLVEITYQTSSFRKTLTQPGSTSEYTITDFDHYDIQFNVQPYPEAGNQIPKKDYQLHLVITKITTTS